MNTLEFIAAVVQAIAWPIVLLLAVLILRKQIDHLIELIRTVKFEGIEVALGKEVSELREQIAITQGSPSLAANQPVSLPEKIIQLAAISPRAVVVESWKEIQQALLAAARKHSISVSEEPDYPAIAERLQKKHVLNPPSAQNIRRIQDLVRKFTDGFEKVIPVDVALELADLCFDIAAEIRTH